MKDSKATDTWVDSFFSFEHGYKREADSFFLFLSVCLWPQNTSSISLFYPLSRIVNDPLLVSFSDAPLRKKKRLVPPPSEVEPTNVHIN